MLAYKILTAPQMAELLREGSFAGAPIDLADGYIHMSTVEQVDETVAKHFVGQSDLFVAAISLPMLGDAVRWEPSRGEQLFPHIYAALPLTAVRSHGPLEYGADGRIILPTTGAPPPA